MTIRVKRLDKIGLQIGLIIFLNYGCSNNHNNEKEGVYHFKIRRNGLLCDSIVEKNYQEYKLNIRQFWIINEKKDTVEGCFIRKTYDKNVIKHGEQFKFSVMLTRPYYYGKNFRGAYLCIQKHRDKVKLRKDLKNSDTCTYDTIPYFASILDYKNEIPNTLVHVLYGTSGLAIGHDTIRAIYVEEYHYPKAKSFHRKTFIDIPFKIIK